MDFETDMDNKKDQQTGIVWDIPVRIFHWGLVISTIGAVASSKIGIMFWHEKMGLTILGLIGFRIIWGFVGTPHARFRHFMVRPRAVIHYIKQRLGGDRTYHPGHAPTGAYATVLILLIFGVMAILGTMAHDDIFYEGPLAAYVGGFSDNARHYHHMMERLIIAVLVLHLLAILVYRLALKIDLLSPMIKGGQDKAVPPPSLLHQTMGIILLVAMVGAAHSLSLLGGDRFL